MIHTMNLWNDSFAAIKSGSKTIEMRLNDPKRKLIHVGDTLEFTNTQTKEKLSCSVIAQYVYKNFEDLYKNHSHISIGYPADEVANPEDMLAYYKGEDISRWGVVGIEIKLL